MPNVTIDQAMQIALQHHQAGRLQQAEQLYRQILAQAPRHARAMHHLGLIAQQLGQNDVAVDLIRQAVALMPNDANARFNLGIALRHRGQLDEAIVAYRQAIALRPDDAEARNNLGITLVDKGQLDEAIVAYHEAIALRPGFAEAYSNLGNALKNKGALDEAITAYRQALALRPGYAEAHNNLGSALRNKGSLDEAIAACRQAIALRPDFAEAHYNLGNALREKGLFDEAIATCSKAIALRPNLPEAHSGLGNALKDKGRIEEAIAAHRQAIVLKANYAEAHINLGNAQSEKGLLDDAIVAYRQAIALNPDLPEAHCNLGNVLKDEGELDEAIAAYRQAIALDPNLPAVHSNLLYTLHYHGACDASFIAEEHRRWDRAHAEPLRKFIQPHTNDRNPDRRLRIGYVSPDFKQHAVAPMVLPLLACHDRENFQVFCYAQVHKPDAMTERFRAHADQWRNTVGLSDEQLARLIRQDQIDILVDLAGHTAGSRLLVFARKPAPIQIARQGYPNTTGLSTIDYRMTDAHADPPGQSDTLHTEQLIRLPQTNWIYQPPDNGPAPNHCAVDGSITFGCFNNLAKVTEPMLLLWGRILQAVPGSRLLLKAQGLGSQNTRRRVLELLSKEGTGPERVELRGWETEPGGHLALYNRVDIALDPYPYHGTTTTCEALWMGVPVITLAGHTHVSRVGVSLLTNMGLPELIAAVPQEYIQTAVELASDLPRLRSLHSSLRQRMEQSPLADAPRFARNVEAAYHETWRRWCQSSGPVMLRNSAMPDEAIAASRQIIGPQPNSAADYAALGKAMKDKGLLDEAIAAYRQAVALRPSFAEAHSNLGNALSDNGLFDDAIAAYRRALAINAGMPEVHSNLGNAREKGLLDDAIASYGQALALNPILPEGYSNLGNALKDKGQVDDAIAAFRQAIDLRPNFTQAHSNLLYTLHYHAAMDASFVAEEHRRWGRVHAEPLEKFIKPHANDPSPDRRLRIGYVSPDFKQHAVAPMVMPLLACHDRENFQVFCYAQVHKPDAMTERFRTRADQWRSTVGLSDEQLTSLIRQDQIDILVDLAGHTAGSRLLAFARKPAPIQITYLGYPNTTGLSTMDYRMTDAYADPPGLSDTLHTEQLIRLPQTNWICQPPENSGARDHFAVDGSITFGCFNTLAKITEPMLLLWGQILHTRPNCRLLLKALGLNSQRTGQRIRDRLATEGIDPGRVELRGWEPTPGGHLALYNRVDIALDPYPYHGTTTTLEALWMGVPVITLAVPTHVSRVGVSLLTNMGLSELIAASPKEYIEIAVELANDLPRLRSLHSTLRQRMEQSPLMDAPRFARNIEAVYRQIWRKWCATPGQPTRLHTG